MYWCCLTCYDERSAIEIEGYARNDDAREALSKLRGASNFMHRTNPIEPIELAEPLSHAIKGQHALRANPESLL